MLGTRMKVCQIAGVAQLIVVDDRAILSGSQHIANEIRAYEPRSTGDKNLHRAASRFSTRSAGSSLEILLAPVSATRLLARNSDSNVPASVHQPSRIS